MVGRRCHRDALWFSTGDYPQSHILKEQRPKAAKKGFPPFLSRRALHIPRNRQTCKLLRTLHFYDKKESFKQKAVEQVANPIMRFMYASGAPSEDMNDLLDEDL
jgi:hypothetical protein